MMNSSPDLVPLRVMRKSVCRFQPNEVILQRRHRHSQPPSVQRGNRNRSESPQCHRVPSSPPPSASCPAVPPLGVCHAPGRFLAILGVDRLDHICHLLSIGAGHDGKYIIAVQLSWAQFARSFQNSGFVTSFYQSLQTMSFFLSFNLCNLLFSIPDLSKILFFALEKNKRRSKLTTSMQ